MLHQTYGRCLINKLFPIYRTHAVKRLVLCDKHFQELPRHHRAMLSNFKEHLAQIRSRINHNYEIIKLIIENTEDMFENKNHSGNSVRYLHLKIIVQI